ncbi:hypothetical protein J6590_100455 [Homalodisca vitripennis]|nr:hypothetical protein J6590_100455 [Homalodisca vitripennis]
MAPMAPSLKPPLLSHSLDEVATELIDCSSRQRLSVNVMDEVEKRPALYNKQLKEYSDRNIKEKLWTEVCGKVIENWNDLTSKEKKHKGTDVQKKWKNLKDCFLREIAAQRKTTSGQGATKRRKYIHFDALLFLVPFVKGRETISNISLNETDGYEPEQPHDTSDDIQEGNSTARCSLGINAQTERERRKNSKKQNANSYETSLLNILKARQSDEGNEDKHFALMLVPMLGKLNEEQKHYAKIEILNVMRQARNINPRPGYISSSQHTQQPQHSHSAYGHNSNQPVYPQNTGPMQNFYNDFAGSVLSSPSASGSDLFDLS